MKTSEQRAAALQILHAAGIGTSDCQLIANPEHGSLELRSASGAKLIAVVALTQSGVPVAAWRS